MWDIVQRFVRRGWLLGVLLVVAAACSPSQAATANDLSASGAPGRSPLAVRVGYFPNITHSQALIGLSRGDFQQALGPGVSIDARVFNAGPAVIEALFAGQLDLAYIGPNPAINGYVQSGGQALRIIAGATSGGAALITRADVAISGPADLAGKKLATPQLGNTQDVALRAYLAAHGLKTTDKGGTVEVVPTDNPQILDLFRRKQIDGAWVPEPWASRLIIEGKGRLFLDERTLWPGGDFVTTNLIVRTEFLQAHPEVVKSWLRAHAGITLWETGHPEQAQQLANDEIKRLTGQALPPAVVAGAWSRMRVTNDPLSSSLRQVAANAYQAGLLKEKPDLSGIYDLSLLNQVLADLNQPSVE